MDETPNNRARQIVASLAVLVVIVVIVAAAILMDKDDKTIGSTGSDSNSSNTSTASNLSSTAKYTDGTYTAEGGYSSPGGFETITITLTLKDGVITDTSAESGATNTEAEEHQADFIATYEEVVVGKKIGTLELNRVAGASLTTGGFNNAIGQIRDQAEA